MWEKLVVLLTWLLPMKSISDQLLWGFVLVRMLPLKVAVYVVGIRVLEQSHDWLNFQPRLITTEIKPTWTCRKNLPPLLRTYHLALSKPMSHPPHILNRGPSPEPEAEPSPPHTWSPRRSLWRGAAAPARHRRGIQAGCPWPVEEGGLDPGRRWGPGSQVSHIIQGGLRVEEGHCQTPYPHWHCYLIHLLHLHWHPANVNMDSKGQSGNGATFFFLEGNKWFLWVLYTLIIQKAVLFEYIIKAALLWICVH